MAAARAALALSLLASFVKTGEAEPCAPRAELGGDAEAVAQVATELRRLGVDAETDPTKTSPRSSCPKIVAAVELDRSGGIAVAVRDGAQRSEGRVVSDASLAAAWIDSWLRDDFAVPIVEAPAPPSATPPRVVAETPAAAPAPLLDRFSLAASYLQIWSDDSTSWSGVAGSLCLRIGDACVGARAGYARQTVTTDQATAAAKRDLSLLATASYSVPVGRMSIAPELGVGVGRTSIERVEGCQVNTNCDPMNPTPDCMMTDPTKCTMDPVLAPVGDNFATSTFTPRISAALRIAIPLFDHVWLDGYAAATAAPFGHDEPYAVEPNPDGTTMMPPGSYPLPGDPLVSAQLGVGLRLGAR